MTEREMATDTRQRLAVLRVMGWPDDRDEPAFPRYGEADATEVYWGLAGEIVRAVNEAAEGRP